MKKVEYCCDLCKETKPKAELNCMYFKCSIIPQRYILSKDLDGSDKHICDDCIELIKTAEVFK